mgnify:FL=1
MDKVYIQPKDIKSVWGFVKPNLYTILEKSPENWIPEDIYAAIVTGQAILCISTSKTEPNGFVVGRIIDIDTLHIWVGYANTMLREQEQWKLIEQIAKEQNCKRISFETWRKGWSKKAEKLGFYPRTYIKELS